MSAAKTATLEINFTRLFRHVRNKTSIRKVFATASESDQSTAIHAQQTSKTIFTPTAILRFVKNSLLQW